MAMVLHKIGDEFIHDPGALLSVFPDRNCHGDLSGQSHTALKMALTVFGCDKVAAVCITQELIDGVRGHIVNISSCSAYTSSPSRGEYCISKAGCSMITKLFADRLACERIPVNEVCPGIIATGMTEAVKEKYDRLIEGGLVPLGRWGQPEDVARAAVALCDGTFPYTTGTSLIVDGGMHIRSL
jgi:NAD(P)-dependent dehydrogenase (short-subunit alcohol dehydrogenase family)